MAMVEEQGRVVEVWGSTARVQTLSGSACQSCRVRGGCGQRMMAEMAGNRKLHINLDNSIAAQAGDQVTLGIAEQALLRASVVVYLVPLIGLLAGALVGDQLFRLSDGGTAWAAFTGMVLFFLLGKRALKRVNPGRFKPVLIKILGPASSP